MEGIVLNYTFLMDFFKEEVIFDNLMGYYKDFDYVNYIIDLPFDRGFKLYKKCLDNIKDQKEEKRKERLFKLWLFETERGYKHDFETYCKINIKQAQVNNMTKDEKEIEEDRIINKMTDISNKKFKTRRLRL